MNTTEFYIKDFVLTNSISTTENGEDYDMISDKISKMLTENSSWIPQTLNHTVTTSINFLPLGLGLILVCSLGLIGNILCALVLMRPKMKSTYSVLTIGLTFCDSIYLLTKLFRYGLQSFFLKLSIAKGYTDIFYPIVGPQMRAITFTAHTGSTYITIAVALDRYLSVCWPYQARTFCTIKRAGITTLVLILFSIAYNMPRWWEFHTEINYVEPGGYNTSKTDSTFYKMAQSPLRSNATYKKYYIFWSYFFIMFFLPFTSLSAFNFLIWRAIQSSTRKREKLTSHQKRDASFAMMLFSVVIVFLVCSVDYLILDLIDFAGYKYSSFWDNLGNFLLTLNSAVNFIIYCAFGRKFREEFVVFCNEITGRVLTKPGPTTSDPKSASTRCLDTDN